MFTNPKVKDFLRKVKIVSLFVAYSGIIYVAGTFYPNKFTVNGLENQIETKYADWANNLGLHEPAFEYNTDAQFVEALGKCIDYVNFKTAPDKRVPIEMIVGQAALESAWGKSRFAREANNLFGIRTYDTKVPHLYPEGVTEWKGWGVRKFETKCDGVKFFVELLNNHHAYEKFRKKRESMLYSTGELDAIQLVKTLDKYSTTPDYADRVISIIKKLRTM